MQSMKVVLLIFGLALLSCKEGGIKYGKGGDDNSHLRNPQNPNHAAVNSLPRPDSIVSNDKTLYMLDRDLMLNGMFVLTPFTIEKCIESVAKPDSIHKGGPEIIAEFGHDDYGLYFDKSYINVGHGQILMMKIRDEKLKLFTIGVGSSRNHFEKILKYDFPQKDTVNCLGVGDDYYSFVFDNNVITEIDYYAPPL